MTKIENWSLVMNGDAYTPPECFVQCLCGEFPDGKKRVTSAIVKIDGKRVFTHSGSEYEVGKPDPKYVQFCIDNKFHVPTEEHPFLHT